MGIRPLLTRKEVAAILRIHQQTVWDLIQDASSGFPQPSRIGRGVGELRWTEEQINTYIEARRGEPLDLSVQVRAWTARGARQKSG